MRDWVLLRLESIFNPVSSRGISCREREGRNLRYKFGIRDGRFLRMKSARTSVKTEGLWGIPQPSSRGSESMTLMGIGLRSPRMSASGATRSLVFSSRRIFSRRRRAVELALLVLKATWMITAGMHVGGSLPSARSHDPLTLSQDFLCANVLVGAHFFVVFSVSFFPSPFVMVR